MCGTDTEFYSGAMSYLHTGQAHYPVRIGHEWSGKVVAVGASVARTWMGRRVIGDTMLGCGHCERCLGSRQHVCADRFEIGIRNGWPGALAERLVVPVSALHRLPDSIDPVLGALVEPGGNALRAYRATGVAAGDRLLVLGPGTIGLLVALFARAEGVEVHLVGRSERSMAFARGLGFENVWTTGSLPALGFDAIVDATNDPAMPALALELVEPGKRVVYIGIAGTPSMIDARTVALKDVTVVGHSQRVGRPGGDDRAVRVRRGRSAAARRGDGVAGAGRGCPCRQAAGRRGRRPEGSRRPAALTDQAAPGPVATAILGG